MSPGGVEVAGRRVLVTGAAGLVGANLVGALRVGGARVRATVHRKPLADAEGVEVVTCDLRDAVAVRAAVEGCEWVFHGAALGGAAASFQQAGGLEYLANFDMDRAVLEACTAAGVAKLVWLGSTTAYPPSLDRPVVEEDLLTGEPFEKYYGVGWCKRFTEVLFRLHARSGRAAPAIAVLRPTAVYGPHDDFQPASSHVIPALIRRVVAREQPLEVWGTGDEQRDFIYVDDVVRAMLLAAGRVAGLEAYNLGAGRTCTIRELVETLVRIDGFPEARIQFRSDRPTTIQSRSVSLANAREGLGWVPEVSLEEGLARTLAWFRSREAGLHS